MHIQFGIKDELRCFGSIRPSFIELRCFNKTRIVSVVVRWNNAPSYVLPLPYLPWSRALIVAEREGELRVVRSWTPIPNNIARQAVPNLDAVVAEKTDRPILGNLDGLEPYMFRRNL